MTVEISMGGEKSFDFSILIMKVYSSGPGGPKWSKL
jgi:hypothetical protein